MSCAVDAASGVEREVDWEVEPQADIAMHRHRNCTRRTATVVLECTPPHLRLHEAMLCQCR